MALFGKDKESPHILRVGVVGYSGQKFDENKAKAYLHAAFEKIHQQYPHSIIVVVSGLTDIGIPALAYREAKSRGWLTAGIACSKAENKEKYTCYDVNYKEIVGSNWGDESGAFLNSIDILVRVGGGPQTKNETNIFKAMLREREKIFVQELGEDELPALAVQPGVPERKAA